MIPSTFEAAVEALGVLLCEEDRANVLANGKDLTSLQVRTLVGRHLRNEWGLWTGGPLFDHMKGLGYDHPDDMSAAIIDEFIRMSGRGVALARFERKDVL